MADRIAKALSELGRQLWGRVSLPGDEYFAAATHTWVKPTGPTPRAVVRCGTAEDVQAAIRAARGCGLPLSVRGGGHDWACRALCAGIVIDMSAMHHATVSADNRVARIGGGALASDVVAATDASGLAAVTGAVGAVGMAGLTLGGGYGPLIGRFGLALDNLILAEVVLADGRIVFASRDQEPDLFWALRGGGGNFGVVTEMHHRAHALPRVLSGVLIYPFAEARSVLARCAEIETGAPDPLSVQLGIISGPDGTPVVFVASTWSGEPGQGEAQIAPLRKVGTLLADTVRTLRYGEVLAAFDDYLVEGQRVFMETSWLPTLDRDSIDVLIRARETAPSPGCAIITHGFRGAAARVPIEATAFALRRDHVLVEILATFADRGDRREEERHARWARDTRLAFGSALPGGYPNILAPGDNERAAQSYGPNAVRLAKAKRRYDPDNVFRSAIPLPLGEQRVAAVAAAPA